MKKILPLLVMIVFALSTRGQDAEVLHIFDSSRTDLQDGFLYIEEPIDLTLLTHVALIQVSSDSRAGLETLYSFSGNQASELGANCYRVTEFEHQENGLRIILDLYYINEASKKNIREHQPQNRVYVFGSDNPDKTFNCKVNNRKIELPPFTFYREENKIGQEIKVSKGGLTGMAVWVTWAEGKPARYITLSGFGLSGVGVGPGVGAGFNTGRLSYLEPDIGRFLSVVMKPLTLPSAK
jgi:hypothetical protein